MDCKEKFSFSGSIERRCGHFVEIMDSKHFGKWCNEGFVAITKLLKPGCRQIIAHQSMGDPFCCTNFNMSIS